MKKSSLLYLFSVMLFLISCGSKTEEKDSVTTAAKDSVSTLKEFEMYEMSQMAALMEQMYVDNQRLKSRITEGDTIGTFPKHFLNIHASAMTDETDNDAYFKEQAAKFIEAQELIYKDSVNAKKHFNDAVSACLRCHQVKCAGPIPRIKKLYIN